MTRGQIIVMSGPPGAGKTSVRVKVLEAMPNLTYSVSLTTRPPRPGEVDGVDYHFVSRDDFKRRVDSGEMAEHAEIFGHFYGTSALFLQETIKQGKDVFMDVDVHGARGLKWFFDQGLFILLLPPSTEELERRLRARGTEDEAQIRTRLSRVRYELAFATGYTHCVINENLDNAVRDVLAILNAERLRTKRQQEEIHKRFNIDFDNGFKA